MKKNLYQILGVRQNVSQDAIDSAHAEFRAKYQALYDRGDQDASNELFNINGAYEILSKPEKRAAYDEKLAAMQYQPRAVHLNVKAQSNQTVSKSQQVDQETGVANTRLVECKTCGHMVSMAAKTCPKCGEKKPAPQPLSWLPIALAVFVFFWITWKASEPNSSASSSSVRVDSVLNELAEYGRNVAGTTEDGAIHYSAVWPTTTEPIRAYKMDFETNHQALMSDRVAQSGDTEYWSNRGRTEVWKAKFCTVNLMGIMRKHGIGMVSGDLKNKSGETQSMAVCTG
jgi:rubrerythrin